MSIFSKAKDKTEFASGIFRNPESGQKINTASHAKITAPDLNKQGYEAFGSKVVDGREIFSQDIGGGKNYSEVVQRPKGWSPTQKNDTEKGAFAPVYDTGKVTPDGKRIMSDGNLAPTSMTVDSAPEPKTGLQTPDLMTGLNSKDQQASDDALQAELKQIDADALAEVEGIREAGARKMGGAKAFLAKIGALGKTITGAPVDTNLGVLSHQNKLMTDAVNEAWTNRDIAQKEAKTGRAAAEKEQIEAYNKLIQQNFDNAIKLVEQDREMRSADRADKLAELQIDKFGFEIDKANRDITKENIEDAMGSIDIMAESGIGLDQLSVEMINSLETSADLPKGSFEAYFQAKQDAKGMETEENLLKLEKLKADILDQAERTNIAQQQANTSSYNASLAGQRLKFDQDKQIENPGGYSELEIRKLRNEGIDPKNTRQSDEFLYAGDPDTKDIRASFSESIGTEDLSTILMSLETGGIDPYSSTYRDLTAKAVISEIEKLVGEGKTEKEIKSAIGDIGVYTTKLDDNDIKKIEDAINKAPNALTKYF